MKFVRVVTCTNATAIAPVRLHPSMEDAVCVDSGHHGHMTVALVVPRMVISLRQTPQPRDAMDVGIAWIGIPSKEGLHSCALEIMR